jgi:folate-binding protein YgfZ
MVAAASTKACSFAGLAEAFPTAHDQSTGSVTGGGGRARAVTASGAIGRGGAPGGTAGRPARLAGVPAAEIPADPRTALVAVPIARDAVRVAGPDAVTYLQGQLSQDVAGLAVDASARSFVLAPTGRADAWVRVTRTADDEVLIDTDPGAGEAVLARLRRFLLRTKADIEPVAVRAVALRGPGAAAAGERAATAGVRALPAGWPGVEGVDLVGPEVTVPDGVRRGDPSALEALRIAAGVPAVGPELTDRTIPAEVGQWVIDASVSFTKGCFTGQELVARIDSRGGNVPRHLRALVAAGGEALPVGAPVVVAGAEVGTVTSSAVAPDGTTVALAFVGRAVTPPADAEVRPDGLDGPATVPVAVRATPLG